MPGLDTRRWLICYAATVLVQSELPVPIEELFPPYLNSAGSQKVLGRKLQRAIIDGMLSNGYAASRKLAGADHYEPGPAGRKLWGIMAAEDEIDLMAEVFGLSEGQMRMRRYSAKEAERRAKLAVAIRAVGKLCVQRSPQPRNAIFTPAKGDKFEERAAWTPTWQGPFLDALVKLDAIRVVPGSPQTYEAVDRSLLRDMAEGRAKGPTCPYTLLWPESPCNVDHSAEEAPYSRPVFGTPEAAPSETSPAVPADPEPESVPEIAPGARLEQLEVHVDVLKKTVAVEEAALPPSNPSSEEVQSASLELLVKVMECLQSHTRSHSLILDAFSTMTKAVAELKDKFEDLEEAVATSEEAAIQMQKKQEAAQEEFSSFGHLLGSVKKRLGDLEKSAEEHKGASAKSHDDIKKGMAEVVAAFAKVSAHHQPASMEQVAQALEALRAEVAKPRRGLPASFLKKVDAALDEVGALRDIALDAIPGRRTA